MLERIADGLLGLFMFFSNWFSPGSDSQEIKIAAVTEFARGYSLECAIDLDWNEQMSDLIDAGIPLRFKIKSYSDVGDSVILVRTLECDIGNYSYMFCDSIFQPSIDSIYISKRYSQVYRAVRKYSRWNCTFSKEANQFFIEAELLPSRVSQLNRSVDMSGILGCQRFTLNLIKKEDAKVK
ncbi:MAG: hypothetical protein PVI26_00845 [Chitinispirillia bacterium]|jgi:hypothetical protein